MSTDEANHAHGGLLSTLRNAGLRRLFGAEVVSGAGDGVFWVALVVFLADQPRFGLWLTLAVIARLAPRALLSLPAGSLVDRSNLRSLVVGIELLRAGVMVALAVIVSLDGAALPVLALVLASYAVAAPTRPALSAIVPTVAGERHLAGANAVLSTVRQIMTFVGPLLGVAVVAWSPAAGFAVNAATFVVSGLLIATAYDVEIAPDGDYSWITDNMGYIGYTDYEIHMGDAAGDTLYLFEDEELEFHRRVRDGYLALARNEPQRYRVVPADGDADAVERRVEQALAELLSALETK